MDMNALAAAERPLTEAGMPLLVEATISSSSGTPPSSSSARISMTSACDSMSPRFTMCGEMRLTMSAVGMLLAARSPTTRSASRIDDTSGVATTIASSAPATAFLKPCSMPAGQSMMTKSKTFLSSKMSAFICSGVTASFSSVCEAGRR